MSKIYRALEKAERERESKKDISPISEIEEEKRESRQTTPVSRVAAQKVSGITSDQQLVFLYQPGAMASEQFRKLRTHLFRNRRSELPRTIMITSATDSEGKTFVTGNLGVSIAQDLNAHTLLVDCDFRNPSLSQLFGLNNGKGLSDYLAGNERISDLLRKTEVEKLTILTSGTVREKPSELIGSEKMEALVNELRSRYSDRYIIFDSTPLLATTEPEVLGKMVDAIIIVVRAGVTVRETVKQAIAPLEKEKILGLVLNDLKFRSPGLSQRYFGSYGYYYKYGNRKAGSNHQGWWKKLFRSVPKAN